MATDALSGADRNGLRPGTVPTEDELFWPAAMRKVQTGLVTSTQSAAKALLSWALVGWTVVVVALISGVVGRTDSDSIGLVIWLLPLGWWTLTAVWALRVFTIRRYRYFSNSPDSAHKAIERLTRKKTEHMYWATGLWAAGMISLICAIIYETSTRS